MQTKASPKYFTIKQNIIRNIQDSVYKPGKTIPSERELIDSFKVSRITVRAALSELEHEGYLYKVQGKGTYVKDNANKQNLYALTSCTKDIIRMGKTPSKQVLSAKIDFSDNNLQQTLNLKQGEKVFYLDRIFYADGEPINNVRSHLPYKYIKGIEKFDFSNTSLHEVLESKYEINITRSVKEIQAVIAEGAICDILDVSKGTPMLLLNCVTYGKINGKEVPIEAFSCHYRSDKFTFFIQQAR